MDRLEEISKELDEMAFRRKLALDTTCVGYWDWNMETGKLWWSDNMFSIYGVKKSEFTGHISFWYDQLDKEGLRFVSEKLQKSIEKDIPYIAFFKIRDRDYQPKQVFAVGSFIKSKKGVNKRMVGINIEIPSDFKIVVTHDKQELECEAEESKGSF